MDIRDFFQMNKEVAVAFSGGVDSAVLLLLSKQYAKRVEAYYVKSAFQPSFEFEDAKKIAERLNVKLNVIAVDVLSDGNVIKNPSNRCYYCKKRIFSSIKKAAESDGFETVLDGTNASDDVSDRPGFAALGELGVKSPLREAGCTKSEIRTIAEENGIHVAHKPSYSCLATRIPTGTLITKELLRKTEESENRLFEIGFRNFRVRNMGNAAKIELCANDFELLIKNRNKVISLLSPYYDDIYLDLKERADEQG